MFKSNFFKAFSICIVLILMSLPMVVNAASMFCRSDPIVFLSDGTRLQFNAAVATSQENVIGIHYQLHVPFGVSIERIIFTPRWARDIETVELVNDQTAGNYQINAMINTGNQVVDVEIGAMKTSRGNGGGSHHQSVQGLSGQAIFVFFNN